MPHILICDYILNRSLREKRASFHDCCILFDMVVYAVADAIVVYPVAIIRSFVTCPGLWIKYA